MRYIRINNKNMPNIVAGCMRYADKDTSVIKELVGVAIENGVNFFDHADIYGGDHDSERVFRDAVGMTPTLREKMILQTKCGIVRKNFHYDFSKKHIIEAVEGSLKALGTDYIDILLLHRPDTLVEPEEVASAFDELLSSGKVRMFGVSNHTPLQIELLKKSLTVPILFNQLQLSAVHTLLFDHGFNMNINNQEAIDKTNETIEYCRINNITVQAWSPFQKGFFKGVFLDDPEYLALNKTLSTLAKKYNVTPSAIATAFITRHPANMQVIVGTTNKKRLLNSLKGSAIPLTRDEWYGIYKDGNKKLP